MTPTVRPATPRDASAIKAFTRDTWPERDGGDYLPAVIDEWIETEDERRRTLVAAVDGDAAGVVQAVLLSPWEAWVQGMRVDPDRRGEGLGTRLTRAAFAWARDEGAVVARNMVFSWNAMGLGLSRAAGFEPVAEFRWAHPAPDADADPGVDVTAEPAAAWQFWQACDARSALAGLALDPEESWALSDLTRDRLARAADDTFLGVVQGDGTQGVAFRARDFERDRDGETERWAEYGVGAWSTPDAAGALLAAISRDAARIGADRTRVLIPETARAVSDVAAAGVSFSEEPDFVFAADLTDDRVTAPDD